MNEKQLLEAIQESYKPTILFRNDNGSAWVGGRTTRRGGLTILDGAKRIKYGLQPGSGDFIGWTPKIITPADVGKTVAIFTSIEAKTENDALSDEQIKWYQSVERSGGRALIVWEHMGELSEFIP